MQKTTGRTFAFTDRALKGLPVPPKPKQLDYFDTNTRGLGLRVSYGGQRSFFLMYSSAVGKRQRKSLGTFGKLEDGRLSLAAARRKAKATLGDVASGGDPAGEARAQRLAPTVAAIAADWIKMRQNAKRSKSWQAQEAQLEREVLPVIGSVRGCDLEDDDIERLLDRITDRPAPIMANRMHEIISAMLRWASKGKNRKKYRLTTNVAEGWEPNAETERDRFLSLEELGAYWHALDHEGDGPAAALRLLLLTGQRQQNILGMRRDQLFLQDQVWRVPPSSTKTDKTYKVPLSRAAMAIIEERLAAIPDGEQYLFPKSRGGDGPAGRTFAGKPHRRACKRAGVADYTPHDHRHSFGTHCDIMGIPRLVWDGILGHSAASMAELYSGHDFAEQRLDCGEWTADRIAATLSDNVVPITKDTAHN